MGGESPPDILYHATTAARAARAAERGALDLAHGQPVFLSTAEEAAWRVAHRQAGDPVVLVIDAARARREGVSFSLSRQGLWQARAIPAAQVLNLRADYAEQASAGGFLIYEGSAGPELALIRVDRRIGATWEVAKGKLELGETPAQACLREMTEEMGLQDDWPLEIVQNLGAVRYGFHTPSGEPRLKTLHLFLVRAAERWTAFAPRKAEGILEVSWFSPREAARLVHHRSLRPLMEELVYRLEQRDQAPDAED